MSPHGEVACSSLFGFQGGNTLKKANLFLINLFNCTESTTRAIIQIVLPPEI